MNRLSPTIGLLAGLLFALAPLTAAATPNPQYKIDPQAVFPTPDTILVHGATYNDTIPDTLDLPTVAESFLRGASRENVPLDNIWIPGGPGYFNPDNPGNNTHAPALLDTVEGYQNWGKLALGMFLAREMSGYDLDDADGTMKSQYRSITTALSWDTLAVLRKQAREKKIGGMNLVYPHWAMTPASVLTQALIARYRQNPSNSALAACINEYVRMHKGELKPQSINGITYYDFIDPSVLNRPAGRWDTFGGYNGAYSPFAFINGRGAVPMFQWYALTGSKDAFDIATKLTAFMRDYAPMWANPDPTRFPYYGPGQFEGHIHSFLQAAHSFTDEAAARLAADPNDPLAKKDIHLADAMYKFTKHITKGDVLGNYGEMDSTDDMIRLGIDLSQLGAGPYWDEVERWTRNTLADRQIDPATAQRYIANKSTDSYYTDHVGDKVTGLFFSDCAQSLAVPLKAWMYNIDDATNPMHAAYEVWSHTLQVKGSLAQVNFDLNRQSQYLDIKSDLPYRGQINIVTKSNIGPLAALAVRIPSWADNNSVTVFLQDTSGLHPLTSGTAWGWSPSSYVHIPNIKPSSSYLVRFPIKVCKMPFHDIRGPDQFWYEGSHPSPNRGAAEKLQTFTGTFRGNTLVDAQPRPTAGIPRYQRQNLAALPPIDVAPPTRKVRRFVLAPN